MRGVEERIRDAGQDLAGQVGASPRFEDLMASRRPPRASHRTLVAAASLTIFVAAGTFAWKAFSPNPITPRQDADVFIAVNPHTENVQMTALLRAPMVVKNGCVLVGEGSSLSLPIWPKGFAAGLDESGRVVIRDTDQRVVAIEGQVMDMSGGYVAEFQPVGKVDPKDEQIAAVESGLGYQLPEACLSGIYGIWQVGQTTPLMALPASGGQPKDRISLSYVPDGFTQSENGIETYPNGAQLTSKKFHDSSSGFTVYAMRRPEPLDLGTDLGFKVNVDKLMVGGHDAYLLTAKNGSHEISVIEWQTGPVIVKVFGEYLPVETLKRIAAGVTIDSSIP